MFGQLKFKNKKNKKNKKKIEEKNKKILKYVVTH